MSSRLAYGCLTHVPLATEFPTFVEPILLGEAQTEGASTFATSRRSGSRTTLSSAASRGPSR